VGQSVGVSIDAVSAVIARAIAAGLAWPAVQALTDDVLEAKLYHRSSPPASGRCRTARTSTSNAGRRA
jgi:hypothetical protein